VTPKAIKRATFEKDSGSDSRTVVHAKTLDIEYGTYHASSAILIKLI
jgi:hypothetical protein